MQKRVVIVGAGNAGSIVANELAKKLGDKVEITVIEPSDYSLYQPGIVDFVVGHERIESIKREVSSLLDKRVKIVKDKAAKVSPETGKVVTEKGKEIEFDYLVLSPGVKNKKGALPSWHSEEDALKLRQMIESFSGKKIVVGYYGIIKCPAAPFELAFLLKQKFPEAKITFINPVAQPPELQKPMASKLAERSKELGIEIIRGAKISTVNVSDKVIQTDDGQKISYDLALIDTPIYVAEEFSNLVDSTGFIPVDKETLKVNGFDNIYAVGDVTNIMLPPKTGAIAHYGAIHVAQSIYNDIMGFGKIKFDGSAMCAVYGGYGNGYFIYMNYNKSRALGPSSIFHSAKRSFTSLYWLSLKGTIDPFLEIARKYFSGGPELIKTR